MDRMSSAHHSLSVIREEVVFSPGVFFKRAYGPQHKPVNGIDKSYERYIKIVTITGKLYFVDKRWC